MLVKFTTKIWSLVQLARSYSSDLLSTAFDLILDLLPLGRISCQSTDLCRACSLSELRYHSGPQTTVSWRSIYESRLYRLRDLSPSSCPVS